ncbi:hypothetical protein MMC07_002809 [Pseudocyphellaria aurata]|nr:hypothetical protein [Pseudocyphellaria aurata]
MTTSAMSIAFICWRPQVLANPGPIMLLIGPERSGRNDMSHSSQRARPKWSGPPGRIHPHSSGDADLPKLPIERDKRPDSAVLGGAIVMGRKLGKLARSAGRIYVAFPRISQDGIDDSTLEIQSLTLSDPTPESFHLEQTAIVGNDNRYHPRLDAFNASLSLDGPEDKPYAYIELPAIHATAIATSYVNQTVKITDPEAFMNYNRITLINEEVKVAVRGRTPLHEMRFPTTTVDYNKVVTLKALNNFNGFNVTSFEIKLEAESDGTNMIGTVYIPNPSVMTISFGNLTFNNYVQGDFIGTSLLSDVVLRPGNNTMPMRSTVNQTLVIAKIVSDFQDGLLPIDIVGNSSVYHGQHLPYFEKGLQSSVQHITLNVGEKLAALGLTIPPA